MDISILKKIGLSDKETKIYLGLLSFGAISVRELSQNLSLNRGSVYDALKNLQELGLVTYYHQDTKQRFVAENPDKLNLLIKQREQEIKETKNGFEVLIPQLKSMQSEGGDKPTSRFFEGKKGIRSILTDVLDTVGKEENKEYYIYSATKSSDDINNAYPDFTKERMKKKLSVKAISLAKGGKTHGLDERRWLKTNEDSATFVILYAGKCAYISRDANDQPIGVIIENKKIYATQKIIFLQLWQFLA